MVENKNWGFCFEAKCIGEANKKNTAIPFQAYMYIHCTKILLGWDLHHTTTGEVTLYSHEQGFLVAEIYFWGENEPMLVMGRKSLLVFICVCIIAKTYLLICNCMFWLHTKGWIAELHAEPMESMAHSLYIYICIYGTSKKQLIAHSFVMCAEHRKVGGRCNLCRKTKILRKHTQICASEWVRMVYVRGGRERLKKGRWIFITHLHKHAQKPVVCFIYLLANECFNCVVLN